jgi:hypothetical protein
MYTDPTFIENITNHLKQGTMEVTFTKKNGDVRTLKCTLSPALLPEIKNADRKTSDESLSVFDLNENAWRAFRWDTIKDVHYM